MSKPLDQLNRNDAAYREAYAQGERDYHAGVYRPQDYRSGGWGYSDGYDNAELCGDSSGSGLGDGY